MNKQQIEENSDLQSVIDKLIKVLNSDRIKPDSEEYATLTNQLSMLYKVKETDLQIKTSILEALNKHDESVASLRAKEAEAKIKEREANSKLPVKPETLALLGGNLAGIIMILGYERTNVITSKAFGLLTKLK